MNEYGLLLRSGNFTFRPNVYRLLAATSFTLSTSSKSGINAIESFTKDSIGSHNKEVSKKVLTCNDTISSSTTRIIEILDYNRN